MIHSAAAARVPGLARLDRGGGLPQALSEQHNYEPAVTFSDYRFLKVFKDF